MVERLTFIHPDEKRESEVIISRGRLLGSGGQGEIHEVTVEIGGHKKIMALKEFPFEARIGDGELSKAETAFANYQQAREAGLRVFETFRLSGDRKSILMTNGHDAETICLGTNNADLTLKGELEGKRIENIENFDEFLDNVLKEIIKASKNHFILTGDAMFFFIDRKTRTRLDFVIGDLDICGKTSFEIDLENIVSAIKNQIAYFLRVYLEESKRESYIERMEDFFQLQIERQKHD